MYSNIHISANLVYNYGVVSNVNETKLNIFVRFGRGFVNFFKKIWSYIKAIPWYGWVLAVFFFGLQYGMYRLANLIANVSGATAWAFVPKIPFDDKIPLIPGFVLIYAFSYAFWVIGPLPVIFTKKDNYINFCIGLPLTILVACIIFVAIPSYMDRAAEGLYEKVKDPGFFNDFLRLIYSSDGSSLAFNMIPSLHCSLSLYMYLGIARKKEIALGYRIYSIVMVVFICLSTVFTKQHYIMDSIAGIALALAIFFLIRVINPGKMIVEYQNKKKPNKNPSEYFAKHPIN